MLIHAYKIMSSCLSLFYALFVLLNIICFLNLQVDKTYRRLKFPEENIIIGQDPPADTIVVQQFNTSI